MKALLYGLPRYFTPSNFLKLPHFVMHFIGKRERDVLGHSYICEITYLSCMVLLRGKEKFNKTPLEVFFSSE